MDGKRFKILAEWVKRMYTLFLSKRAEKSLERIPKEERGRILQKLIQLERDPFSLHFKKLEGYYPPFSLRVGMYRILFDIDHQEKRIDVLKIDKRERVYS